MDGGKAWWSIEGKGVVVEKPRQKLPRGYQLWRSVLTQLPAPQISLHRLPARRSIIACLYLKHRRRHHEMDVRSLHEDHPPLLTTPLN